MLESHIEPAFKAVEGYEDYKISILNATFELKGISFKAKAFTRNQSTTDFGGHIDLNLNVSLVMSKG